MMANHGTEKKGWGQNKCISTHPQQTEYIMCCFGQNKLPNSEVTGVALETSF